MEKMEKVVILAGVGMLALAGYFWWWEMNAAESLGVGLLLAVVLAPSGVLCIAGGVLAQVLGRRAR